MKGVPWAVVALSLLLGRVAAAGQAKYEASWASLDRRPTPAWFKEARFGIFIHWGVYSVPAWAPKGRYAEWYWKHMRDKKGPTWQHHVKTHGAEFQYEQFAPKFKAEKFDPGAWAALFKKAGAKYVVLTAKHHDGYCLWPAPDAKGWNSVDVGPKRDLLGDLTQAVREAGLKMGFYYSLYEWFHPTYNKDVRRYVAAHMLPQLKDAVSRYKPSLIFADGEWGHPAATWRSEEFLAWLFNESSCRDEVVVNDRWGKGCRGRHGGYYTSEYGGHGSKVGPGHLWEENQGIGRSFGYNRNEGPDDYRSVKQLLHLLVASVSRGGNLLLDVGPDADGTIPQVMQERLLGIGTWLAANGESIYGAGAGPVPKFPWGLCTAKPGTLYLHVFEWPKGDLELPGLRARVADAYLLADPDRSPLLLGRSEEGAMTVTVPRKAPDPNVSVVVLKVEGEARVRVATGKPTKQAPDGTIALQAVNAAVHGTSARYEQGGGKDNIGFWSNARDWVSWKFDVTKPGTFEVTITTACAKGSGGSTYAVAVGERQLKGKVKETGSWAKFATDKLGTVTLAKPGSYVLSVKPITKPGAAVMNLQAVTLRPVKK